jgi:hypothetical protein
VYRVSTASPLAMRAGSACPERPPNNQPHPHRAGGSASGTMRMRETSPFRPGRAELFRRAARRSRDAQLSWTIVLAQSLHFRPCVLPITQYAENEAGLKTNRRPGHKPQRCARLPSRHFATLRRRVPADPCQGKGIVQQVVAQSPYCSPSVRRSAQPFLLDVIPSHTPPPTSRFQRFSSRRPGRKLGRLAQSNALRLD